MTFKTKENRVLELIKSYEEINKYSCNFKQIDITLVHMQEDYFSFYEKWKDLNFDELVIELTDNNIRNGLLKRLHTLIKKHIDLYKSTEDDFRNLNISNISKFSTNWYFQHKIDLLDSEKKSITKTLYPTEQEKEILLEENRIEQLEVIKNQTDNQINVLNWFSVNYRLRVHELSTSFIATLNDYLPVKEEVKNQNTAITNKEITYFKLELLSKIHQTCNDEQFNDIPELDFINNINLRSSSISLQIKTGETERVIYLINKLSKMCDKENKVQWLEGIIKHLTINSKTFRSKRTHCYKDETNPVNVVFVKKIDAFFFK